MTRLLFTSSILLLILTIFIGISETTGVGELKKVTLAVEGMT
jgi:hypothetical protein